MSNMQTMPDSEALDYDAMIAYSEANLSEVFQHLDLDEVQQYCDNLLKALPEDKREAQFAKINKVAEDLGIADQVDVKTMIFRLKHKFFLEDNL